MSSPGRSKTFSDVGIILKRSKLGESDSVVTLLTRERGKLTVIAKGARKLSSSKRAFLEPGNYIKASFITTHSLPLLTQAMLLEDTHFARQSLAKIRQLTQLLEIFERLFVEEYMEPSLFEDVLLLRKQVVGESSATTQLKDDLASLIEKLGYQHINETEHKTILEYVSSLVEKPMKSFEYLAMKK